MDFRLSPEGEAFREEVRDFLKANWDTKEFDAPLHQRPLD